MPQNKESKLLFRLVGENKELLKSIREVSKELGNLNKQASKTRTTPPKMETKEITAVTKQIDNIQKSFVAANLAANLLSEGLKRGFDAAAKAIAAATDEAFKFEQKIYQLRTVTQDQLGSFQDTANLVIKASKEVGANAIKAGEGIKTVFQAGIEDATDAVKGFQTAQMAARATQSDFNDLIKTGVIVNSNYGTSVNDWVTVFNKVAVAATRSKADVGDFAKQVPAMVSAFAPARIAFDDTLALFASFNNSLRNSSEASVAAVNLLTKLQKPTVQMKKMLDEINQDTKGIGNKIVFSASGINGDLEGFISNFKQKVTAFAEQNKMAVGDIIGNMFKELRASKGMQQAMTQIFTGAFGDIKKAIQTEKDFLNKAFEESTKSILDRWQIFTDNIGSDFKRLFVAVQPTLQEALDFIENSLNQIIGFIVEIGSEFAWINDNGDLSETFSMMADAIGFIVKNIMSQVGSLVAFLASAVNLILKYFDMVSQGIANVYTTVTSINRIWEIAKVEGWKGISAFFEDQFKLFEEKGKALEEEAARFSKRFLDALNGEYSGTDKKYINSRPKKGFGMAEDKNFVPVDPFESFGNTPMEDKAKFEQLESDLERIKDNILKNSLDSYNYETQKIKKEYTDRETALKESLEDKIIDEKKYNETIILYQKDRDLQLREAKKKHDEELKKKQEEAQKAALVAINERYDKELDKAQETLNKIEAESEEKELSKIETLKRTNKALSEIAKKYNNKAAELGIGTPGGTEALKQRSAILEKIEKNETIIKKEALKERLSDLLQSYEKQSSYLRTRAELEKQMEDELLNNLIAINKSKIREIKKLLSTEKMLTHEQRKELLKEKENLENQNLLDDKKKAEIRFQRNQNNINREISLQESKIKSMGALEKISENELLLQEEEALKKKIKLKEADIASDFYTKDQKLDIAQEIELMKLQLSENTYNRLNSLKQKEVSEDQEFMARKMALYQGLAGSINNIGTALRNASGSISQSLGALLTGGSEAFSSGSALFSDISASNSRKNDLTGKMAGASPEKQAELQKQIDAEDFQQMSGIVTAAAAVMARSIETMISNQDKYKKSLEKVAIMTNVFGSNSQIAKDSMLELNESFSDSLKILPGVGEFLSGIVRGFTDFVGLTRSEETKQMMKNLIESDFVLRKTKIELQRDSVEKSLQLAEMERENNIRVLGEKNLDEETFRKQLEVIELNHQNTLSKIREEANEQALQLSKDLLDAQINLLNSNQDKLKKIQMEYQQDLAGAMTSFSIDPQKLALAQMKYLKASSDLAFDIYSKELDYKSQIETAEIELQEDSAAKKIELAEKEYQQKKKLLDAQLAYFKISQEDYNNEIELLNLQREKKLQDIKKDNADKIRAINEKNYNAELSIIDKLYGEKTKKLQQEVDKEIEIIKSKDERLKALQENRNLDQATKQKRLSAFNSAVSNTNLSASFFRSNELDFEVGTGAEKGNETQRKNYTNAFESGAMGFEEYSQKRAQLGLEKYIYYQKLSEKYEDPQKKAELISKAREGQQEYYEFVFDKEKEKIEIETQQAEKRLSEKEKELQKATELEKAEILKLDQAYKDSAGRYRDYFINATRDWTALLSNTLSSSEKSTINKATSDLSAGKQEASLITTPSVNQTPKSGSSNTFYPVLQAPGGTPKETGGGFFNGTAGVVYGSGSSSGSITPEVRRKILNQIYSMYGAKAYDNAWSLSDSELINYANQHGIKAMSAGGVTAGVSIAGESGSEIILNRRSANKINNDYNEMEKMYKRFMQPSFSNISNVSNSTPVIMNNNIVVNASGLSPSQLSGVIDSRLKASEERIKKTLR